MIIIIILIVNEVKYRICIDDIHSANCIDDIENPSCGDDIPNPNCNDIHNTTVIVVMIF